MNQGVTPSTCVIKQNIAQVWVDHSNLQCSFGFTGSCDPLASCSINIHFLYCCVAAQGQDPKLPQWDQRARHFSNVQKVVYSKLDTLTAAVGHSSMSSLLLAVSSSRWDTDHFWQKVPHSITFSSWLKSASSCRQGSCSHVSPLQRRPSRFSASGSCWSKASANWQPERFEIQDEKKQQPLLACLEIPLEWSSKRHPSCLKKSCTRWFPQSNKAFSLAAEQANLQSTVAEMWHNFLCWYGLEHPGHKQQ